MRKRSFGVSLELNDIRDSVPKRNLLLAAMIWIFLSVSLCTNQLLFATAQHPQMELRENEEYDAAQFAASKPAVGEVAPALNLKTLDGKMVSLKDYLGKNIVVIKSGYT